MSRRRQQPTAKPWRPMARATAVPLPDDEIARRSAAYAEEHDLTAESVRALMTAKLSAEVWVNDRYTVHVQRRDDSSVAELSIRRNDRKAIRDWRHFQWIKTEIAGADVEAFELYPAEDRLMDTANQYYLYCLPPGQRIPAGYDTGRNLSDVDEAAAVGAGQRPLPDDWKAPRAGDRR
jgi:hypothetical protein